MHEPSRARSRSRFWVSLLALPMIGCGWLTPGSGVGTGFGDRRPVGFVYTTLYAKNAVLEIDAVQSRVQQDPIQVPNGPRSLAIDPRDRGVYLYVVCELGDTVAVVDRRNRLVQRTINVGRRPYAMAITPNGARAFVTNTEDDTVTVIDMRTNTVLQTVQLQAQATTQPGQPVTSPQIRLRPRGIAVNAAGTHVYVACAAGYVVVLEGSPGSAAATPTGGAVVAPTTPTGSVYSATRNIALVGAVSPLNIVVNSSGAEGETVYISDPQAGRLFYFNGNQPNAAQVQELQGGPWGLALGQNSAGKTDKLYVTLESRNALQALDLPNLGGASGPLSVEGLNPQNVAVSSLGNEIYVSLTGSNNVAVFKRTGDSLQRPEVFNLQQLNPSFIAPTGDLALGGFLNQ